MIASNFGFDAQGITPLWLASSQPGTAWKIGTTLGQGEALRPNPKAMADSALARILWDTTAGMVAT